jgi:hypothetical protein
MPNISKDMEMVARLRIREAGAIWLERLINSFESASSRSGDRYVLIFRNTAEHAAPVNDGAEYGDEGPPISALIPWVQANIAHWFRATPDSTVQITPDGGAPDEDVEIDAFTKRIDTSRAVTNVEQNFDTDGGGTNHETFVKIEYDDRSIGFAKIPDLGLVASDKDALRNEETFTRMQERFGWSLSPEARWGSVKIDGDRKQGIISAYVEDATTLKEKLLYNEVSVDELLTEHRDEFAKAFVSHFVINNKDFHTNNVVVGDDGTLHFIDNGGHKLSPNAYVLEGSIAGPKWDFQKEEFQEELNGLIDRELEIVDEMVEDAEGIIEDLKTVHGDDHMLVERAEFLLENDGEELRKYIENYREEMNDGFSGGTNDNDDTQQTALQDTALQDMKDQGGVLGEIADEFESLDEDEQDKEEIDETMDSDLP